MRRVFLTMTTLVLFAGPAWANCAVAVDSYNSAIAEIEYQLGRYTRCVSNSAGEDDCTSEFRRLRNAQGDYEGAVSSYRDECGR